MNPAALHARRPVKFSDLEVGDYFLDDGTVYEKIDDTLARGPKRHPLGNGVYDFEPEDEVEEA
jgi:hypothetical protein